MVLTLLIGLGCSPEKPSAVASSGRRQEKEQSVGRTVDQYTHASVRRRRVDVVISPAVSDPSPGSETLVPRPTGR